MPLEKLMALEEELGRTMTPQQLAKMLGVCTNTVRKYRDRWGGVEVVPGKLRFFENKVREAIHASTDYEIQSASVASGRHRQRKTEGKTLSRRDREEQTSCGKMGGKTTAQAEETDPDRHGLAADGD